MSLIKNLKRQAIGTKKVVKDKTSENKKKKEK